MGDYRELKTERLILRPWHEEDAADLYGYASDPRVGPIAGWPVHTSVDDSRRVIRNVLAAPETYAVVLRETGRPVGSIGAMQAGHGQAPMTDTEVEVGYWIGVPYWGQGLIPEAVDRLLAHCFEDLGCTAIWCGYYAGNDRSKRVQEKCGFTYHHTEKDVPCDLMGDVRTQVFTRMSRSEWISRRKTMVEERNTRWEE
jgi:ribosomal-protein-alanine N-acetyltransferase